ncbi:octicosapeptide/Phox/Bem1p (PB1) domain-containing protein / tetratricopeptide repeat (TPR)-containing protein [Wolffia australiana]
MGKPDGRSKKKKKSSSEEKHHPPAAGSPRKMDADMNFFIDMARELKEEGNKLFQKRDYKGAILTYEKAVKLLPSSHAETAPLRSNLAACFMSLQTPDFHRAIEACNLALEALPKYSKALLKRAKCYEAVGRLDMAAQDAGAVLSAEPTNATALEIAGRVKTAMESSGIKPLDPEPAAPAKPRSKLKNKKKNSATQNEEPAKEEAIKAGALKVKLVLGEDIRVALLPAGCSVLQLREIVKMRFPNTEAVLVKYEDEEGDLVTITTTEELRWAEESRNSGSSSNSSSLRLYITQVTPDQDPLFLCVSDKSPAVDACVEDWIAQFAQLFKTHLGLGADAYLDLHELGTKVFSEAIDDVVSSEEAKPLLKLAEGKFQEMAALALFNWGSVHLSRAELKSAGARFEEATRLKPDFYEGFFALALLQFERAKLEGASSLAVELFELAEENMERGTELWAEAEDRRLRELAAGGGEEKLFLQKVGLEGLLKEVSTDEAAEQAARMRSQISVLWGTMLYERSVVEFKLKIPEWEECLAAAVEKFKLAGASPTDLAVMIKNHCSNPSAQEGLSFKIDEIIQAWNEMYDAKRWASGVSSFRLEPLFRRRVPKLHHSLEHASL